MEYWKLNLKCEIQRGGQLVTVHITPCVVVGKAVETSWKLAYRPEPNRLPIPVELQTPNDLSEVTFSNLKDGDKPIGRAVVQMTLQDAILAIKVSQAVLREFTNPPYCLYVLTTDHTGPSSSESHDLLLSATPGRQVSIGSSSNARSVDWPVGLYSLELVCREIMYEDKFSWAKTLCDEAKPMFEKEKQERPDLWRGRILVLAQMNRPCHSKGGDFSLHSLVLWKDAEYWERLFGWDKFVLDAVIKPPTAPELEPVVSPEVVTFAPAAAAEVQPVASQPPVPSKEDQWRNFLREDLHYREDAPEWIKLVPVLKALNEKHRHAIRFLDPEVEGAKIWAKSDGGIPEEDIEWKRMKGPGSGGGGAASSGGPLYVSHSFLKSVFFRKYARRS